MHLKPRRALAAMLLSIPCLLSVGCYSAPRAQSVTYAPPTVQSRFGYYNFGVMQTSFFGEFQGLESGNGIMVTLPPFAPLGFALASAASLPGFLLDAAMETDGEIGTGLFGSVLEGTARAGAFSSGVSDETREIITDISIELSLSWSGHADDLHGGDLNYYTVLFGARFAGSRHRMPRPYVGSGWGYYIFDYDAPERADARIGGPYFVLGVELFDAANGPGVAIGVESKWHFYFGDDADGVAVDGGANQLGAYAAAYW